MTTLASQAAQWRQFLLAMSLLAALLTVANQASGQIAGRPVAQPYFDYDWHARFDSCRWRPVYWGFDPYAVWDDDCDEETGECRSGFVAHRPNDWYVAADFVPLTYDPNHDVVVARRFMLDGPTALSTSDLDPEFDSGARLTFGRTFGGCYQVEGIYQGVYSWDDVATVADSGGVLSSIANGFTTETGSFAGETLFTAMHSAEVNFRAWLDLPPGPFDVQLLVGARHMSIDEDFGFQFDVPASDILIETKNDLWGVQLGIDLKWLVHPRCYIDFDAKGAICNNNVQLDTNDAESGVASSDRTAFLGDLLLTANWQMTPSWSIRAGYQALFVNGVAVGPDNLAANAALLQAGRPAQLDDRGEVVFHGPVLGVMWAR